ncbi:heme-degrading domain-containing protein [Frigoribacterium sp. CFBP9039]|uniref:heme-degrading domain-containing protein n=1 Tax=Frigoribacterium TaxID=96492 RepID=UPI001FACB3AB|nr:MULTISPECIES: heme-degrading domain-containing protein [Frigoribacterium]MCJ0702231.1 heme-degrading domain-containing protein [Frigoribacterium faeni]MDY0890850.1 heme-degrading domain-containing protein [Frigoribacterium sp. CFBP9030]MDY0945190.1 heme-degrading domain-containing protein [Frigoribacterium sp. CFBP9039]
MTDDTLLTELAEQEERLVFRRFTTDTALDLGAFLLAEARRRGLAVTVTVRKGRQRVFHAALPGTSLDNDEWLDRKARVVERYGQSSYRVGESFRVAGSTFDEKSRLDTDLYAAHGGLFPVTVVGVGVVGSVGVSGLPQADDHALVVEVLDDFLAHGYDS